MTTPREGEPLVPDNPTSPKPKLAEIAERVTAHLKRFEANPALKVNKRGNAAYFLAHAWSGGARVLVHYVNYQGHSSLSKSEALAYLEWLDKGNVGKHWDMKRRTVEQFLKEEMGHGR